MIEPGDVFSVKYGDDKQVEVKALSARDRVRCMRVLAEVQKAGESGDFEKLADATEAVEGAFKMCVVDCSDEAVAKFDDAMMGEVIVNTLGKVDAKKAG